jgi:membrane-bound serine protease (ClpP class)
LILLGLGFMVAEAFLPSFGSLGIGGVAAFIFGAIILIDTDTPGFGIPLGVIASIAVVSAMLIAAIVTVTAKTHRRRVVTGDTNLIGKTAEVQDNVEWVRVQGESWRIVSKDALRPAQQVKIIGRNGLVLEVAALGD